MDSGKHPFVHGRQGCTGRRRLALREKAAAERLVNSPCRHSRKKPPACKRASTCRKQEQPSRPQNVLSLSIFTWNLIFTWSTGIDVSLLAAQVVISCTHTQDHTCSSITCSSVLRVLDTHKRTCMLDGFANCNSHTHTSVAALVNSPTQGAGRTGAADGSEQCHIHASSTLVRAMRAPREK